MKTEWNLDILYRGLEDPAYEEDVKQLEELRNKFHAEVEHAAENAGPEQISAMLGCQEELTEKMLRLYSYLELRQSVNSEDGAVMAQISRIQRIVSEGSADEAAAKRIYGSIKDVDAFARQDERIRAYAFLLKEAKRDCAHLLSDEAEEAVALMDMTGGGAWGSLQAFLTSTVQVDYDGGTITLPEVRNLALSGDPAVRKAAYEAEIACYDKIAPSIAFALNNIKNQVTTLCRMRGYASPLDMTLEHARMKRETLDAMMEAIREYLPRFRRYLRRKGELLGYSNGLPWYELFAPLGSSEKQYSPEEAKEYLTGCFRPLSPELADMMAEAFDNEWIDFYPRSGKVGGAFCAGLQGFRQSRILTNYDGTFGAVDTLAHELGHAFHNRQMENERILNTDYPMPIAETASTFNEVHLGSYALKQADNGERLALLEQDLKETTQCVVDIYSRYLFETAVFERSQNRFLMAEDLKELMLQCQREAYGDGLDPDCLHPYMWVCKSHYYSSGLSFYNFPYAFGNLFARGLYRLYTQEGETFVGKYREMLRLTAVHTMEECGEQMGVDLTDAEFWRSSLQLIADEIDEFCAL